MHVSNLNNPAPPGISIAVPEEIDSIFTGDAARDRTGWQVVLSTWFLYLGQSLVYPHFTRYYDLDLHLPDWQIGLLMAVPALGALCLQPVWGYISDRILGRTMAFRVVVVLTGLILALYAFSYQWGGFPLLMFAGFLFWSCYGSGLPLNAAIILSYLGRPRRHLFGRIRVAGSISFTLGMFMLAPLLVSISQTLGLYGRTMVFLGGSCMYFLTVLFTRWDENFFERHSPPVFRSFVGILRNRSLIALFVSIFLLSAGASAGAQYIGPYIGHRGLPEFFFATFWFVGVAVEIGLTYNLQKVVRFWGLRQTILIAFASEYLRWLGMSILSAPVWILLLNILQGPAVIGVFFASAMYLDAECEESVRASAQAMIYFSFMTGQVTGFLLSSAMVDFYSYLPRAQAIQSAFFWSSFSILTALVIGTAFMKRETA